jgi:hypothetical protein
MSTVEGRLLDRVRMDLGDLPSPFDFQFAGDGVRDHWYLEHRPIDPSTLQIYRDGAAVIDPAFSGIAVDYDAGMMVFRDPPPAGEVWEVEGRKWRYFSDDDLRVFIGTAVSQITMSRSDASGGDYTSSDISAVEEYPTALNATIQALWALATDASFDIDILAPDGVNIPRSERYRQLMEIINARQKQYDDLAAALNIGVSRIDTFTVRRTAKNTNRLVPVYLPQEYDDRTWPKRALFPPMLQGTEPVTTGIGTHDVDIVSGDPKQFVVEFPFDLAGCTVKNAIRRGFIAASNTTAAQPIGEFTQEVVGARRMRLSLTGAQTRTIPYNCYWELQVQQPGEAESRTELRGLVRATNNEVVR